MLKRTVLLLLTGSMMLFGCATDSTRSVSGANNNVVSGSSNQSRTTTTNNSSSTAAPVWPGGVKLQVNSISNDAFRLTNMSAANQPYRLHISGQMRAFEAVGTALLTVEGRSVPQDSTSMNSSVTVHASEGAPNWGNFKVDFHYPVALSGHNGVFEFYLNSPKDGSKQNSLKVGFILP